MKHDRHSPTSPNRVSFIMLASAESAPSRFVRQTLDGELFLIVVCSRVAPSVCRNCCETRISLDSKGSRTRTNRLSHGGDGFAEASTPQQTRRFPTT